MAIALFDHDRIAYEAAGLRLKEAGKAAIIHCVQALRGQPRKRCLDVFRRALEQADGPDLGEECQEGQRVFVSRPDIKLQVGMHYMH